MGRNRLLVLSKERLRVLRRLATVLLITTTAPFYAACETIEGTIALGAVGATLAGANSPSNEIQQIYYLGVFDPNEQLPPQVYRVRVHGQASFIGLTRFASGWVHASLIDSLGTQIGFDKDSGNIQITKGDADQLAQVKTGRRLMMFGPEGFREAPKDHRLVVVMGSSPEAFFSAIDEALGSVSEVTQMQRNSALEAMLFKALTETKSEREALQNLERDVAVDLAADTGS